MNVGNLYTVKKWFWMLFPTKETALAAAVDDIIDLYEAGDDIVHDISIYWSKLNVNGGVTYFSPDSIIVFLEEDGALKKILTSDGKIGWTWFDENYNDSFEEVKTEE